MTTVNVVKTSKNFYIVLDDAMKRTRKAFRSIESCMESCAKTYGFFGFELVVYDKVASRY